MINGRLAGAKISLVRTQSVLCIALGFQTEWYSYHCIAFRQELLLTECLALRLAH